MPPRKPPPFDSEDRERTFWESRDSVPYVDWSLGSRLRLPRLKPSTKMISLRLPEGMLEDLRLLANKHDVPYQSLLKIFLAERLARELHRRP